MQFAWMKRPGVLKAAKIAGYVAFVFVVFLVSVVLTFPTARLRSYLEARVSQGGYVLRMEDLSLRGLGSAALTGVHLELPPERSMTPDGQATVTKRFVDLDRVDLSVGLFRMLLGDVSMVIEVADGEGTLGPLTVLQTKEKLTIELDEVKDFPIPSDLPLYGVRMAGVLTSGKMTLNYDRKGGLGASTGRLELAAKGLKALKPTLKSQGGAVSLTDADLGSLALEVNLDRRSNLTAFKSERKSAGADATVIHFEKAELDGADIKALIEGHSTLRLAAGKSLGEGTLALEAAFSISEPFFDRQVKLAGEVQTPNKFLRTLLSMDPKWKASQSGSYWGVTCSGPLGHPACLPKKPSIRGGDFKPPAKETDEKPTAEKKEPARPSVATPAPAAAPAPVPTPAPGPAFVAPPPAQPAIPPQPAPATVQAPSPRPDEEDDEAEAKANMNVLMDAINKPKTVSPQTLTPTVIGRGRLRSGLRLEEPQEEAPAAPAAPAQEEE